MDRMRVWSPLVSTLAARLPVLADQERLRREVNNSVLPDPGYVGWNRSLDDMGERDWPAVLVHVPMLAGWRRVSRSEWVGHYTVEVQVVARFAAKGDDRDAADLAAAGSRDALADLVARVLVEPGAWPAGCRPVTGRYQGQPNGMRVAYSPPGETVKGTALAVAQVMVQATAEGVLVDGVPVLASEVDLHVAVVGPLEDITLVPDSRWVPPVEPDP